ncbi:MAG: PilC/PilY family type IV pilus protein, partial [Hydrogenophaga sp.]|nr:PilC/PilY family type IV pilus protein [Hydrogenophaga sp.]
SSTNRGEDHDNTAGPLFRVGAGSITDPEYQYRPRGASSLRDYTPYPGTGTGGLADLTAKYRWHTDFRPDLRNDIATYPGQPVFWQDMTTYTVGYLIEPSGETFGATSGLTFRQIEAYQTGFARNGFTATTQPSWPTGDLTSATETRRVNDFIQAGFTGGGRGFSVSNADSIRGVFDAILSDILNANGVDAGGDISNEENGVASPVGRLKYRVSYRTRDNSGEIEARQLDANGVPVLLSRDINGTTLSPPSYAFWTAGRQLPAHTARRVFSIREGNVGFEFRGRFDALPAITQTTMRAGVNGSRIPGDTTFVDYLRGSSDVLADNAGRLLRVRSGPIGAIVNAPPLFVGPDGDLGYDAFGDVSGQASYAAFRSATSTATPALVAATNAGVVHVLDAWRGQEQAAFMPRRSLKPLIDQAMPYATFAYNLDGPLTAHDLYSGTAWNQVVVGTGGRGEKLMYALRYPMKADGTRTPDASDFLWEAGPEDLNTTDVTMGHLTTPVRAGQTASGHWVMLTSSGHHGTPDGSRAGLLVIDAFRGTLIRSIPLPPGFSAGRGMGAVTRIIDRRQRIVGAYVGDARGQLWRFDLRGTPETWTISYGRPLFVTPGNRPIYGGPSWQLHPQRGTVVVFATGLLMDEADPAAVSPDEGIYGIWDPTSPGQPDNATFTTVVPTDLLQQRIGQFQAATPDGSRSYYAISQNPIDWTVHRGWTLPMGTIKRGERNIDQVRNFGNRVLINTVAIDGQSPTERCDAGAAPPNILYSLRALDGGGGPTFNTSGATALAPGVGPNPEAAMAIMEFGGFTRGVAVTRSGSGVTTRTPEQGDSISPLRLLSGSHQNSGEDGRIDASSCAGLSGGISGDGGSQGATARCQDPPPGDPPPPPPWSDTPWSRQQYPLLQVPR